MDLQVKIEYSNILEFKVTHQAPWLALKGGFIIRTDTMHENIDYFFARGLVGQCLANILLIM